MTELAVQKEGGDRDLGIVGQNDVGDGGRDVWEEKGLGRGQVLPKDPKSLESEPDSHLNLLCDLEQGT